MQSSSDSSSQPAFSTSDPHTDSNNLYLVTFLATLLLLLLVSTALVIRSFFRHSLRAPFSSEVFSAFFNRRNRPRQPQRPTRTRIQPKPLFHDVWFVPGQGDGGPKWDQLMPIAVQPVFARTKRRHRSATGNLPNSVHPQHSSQMQSSSSPQVPTTPSCPPARPQHGPLFRVMRNWIGNSHSPPAAKFKVEPAFNLVELLQISVLIQLPSQHHKPAESTNLMMGITRKPLKQSS
ncbi:hypothetical protein AMATHDRAFT_764 [Amanita thiersii Skay4041]|uniref:Uncharacterized protein n=1 Tax=Amanita thiersii Skay4041 TaxID=703135 RepID=A0A2A9P0P3_9AGAR|nr:hypothetical protein AMATHDRAFT_764 [Amanita thiersii Skay4041]